MSLQQLITHYVPNGVFVITARSGDKLNGMTAAWVSQVSFRPRLLSVSIAPQRYTYQLIKEAGFFAINVLGVGQVEIAKHFGFKSGREVNKFAQIDYFLAPKGSPILKDAVAYFECKLVSICEAGDHSLFLGEILSHKILHEGVPPMIFKWEDFFGGRV